MKDNTIKDYDGNSLDIYEHKIYALADDYINTVLNKPDIDNLVLLDRLWSIYTTLCYKYNHVVTVERYCILININRDTFYTWYKGEQHNDWCEELGSSRADTVKKWDKECESSWQDEASTGNPGPMFVRKSRRGWSENAPAIGMSEERMLHKTPEQIAADYPVQIEQKEG